MAVKKSEIYSSLWKSCDELRGGMDASQYKDYVLVLLFVKYVSDKYAGDPRALIEVPKGGSFADMVALKGDKEIGDKINKIISKLAGANDLKGVIDVADFNDAELNGVEPYAYLTDVLTRMVDGHPVNRLDELLPWTWKAENPVKKIASCASSERLPSHRLRPPTCRYFGIIALKSAHRIDRGAQRGRPLAARATNSDA